MLDEVGLDGLTMRRLATALKIQAPSLYWHFPNKQALLDGMADAIFGAVSLPRNLKGKTWDVRLKAVFRAIRRAFLAHRDGARVFAGTYVPTDNVLRIVEAMMALMQGAGAGKSESRRAGTAHRTRHPIPRIDDPRSNPGGVRPAWDRGTLPLTRSSEPWVFLRRAGYAA